MKTRCLKTAALLTTMMTATLPGAAFAATQIDADSTTPLETSSAGDITITDEAELAVDGADPITIDSNNSVAIDEDASVVADGADGRSGIAVQAGRTFGIENDGTIEVLEDFAPEDDDGNGVADGPIAGAGERYGIHVEPGGAVSGSIVNNGTIEVEGLDSAGIAVDSDLTGDIVNSGTIAVEGDYSVGIRTASVDGDISIDGTVSVVGEGAQGLVVDGDVSGTLAIQGTVSKGASVTLDDGTALSLSRSDLRVVAPVVEVAGDVAGGILVAAPPYDLDDDEDDEDADGVDDDEESTGAISSVGESPALLIGGSDDIVVGGVEGRDGTFSLAVDGDISATGYYSTFDATAVVIGGQGGAVDLVDGIGVSGSIRATTQESGATALLINEGAHVPSLSNSGVIMASVSSSGEAELWAIRDLSGTLTSIENSGHIQALGSNEDLAIAIDLSANTTGVTIRQYLNEIDAASKEEASEQDDYDPENPPVYTTIVGDIRTGSGDDLLDISSGTVDGDAFLGAGDDEVRLSDDSVYRGAIHAGAGEFAMSVGDTARFIGTLDPNGSASQLTILDQGEVFATFENADDFTVDVTGGTLGAPQGETASFGHLRVGADGAIAVIVDPEDGTASNFEVGTATFAEGSRVKAEVTSLANAEGTYRILTAGTLNGAPTLDSEIDLPVLLRGELLVGDNALDLTIEHATAEELGLTRSQSTIYQAAIAASANSATLESSFLQVPDAESFQEQLDTLLPDHAGGVFDLVTRGSRLAAKHVSDDSAVFSEDFTTEVWLEPIYLRGSKDAGETSAFETDGWGLSGGLENDFGFGYLGLSGAYVSGDIVNGDALTVSADDDGEDVTVQPQSIAATVWELAGHWRLSSGPLYTYARVSAAQASLASSRVFIGSVDGEAVALETAGEWDALALSAMAGASYGFDIGENFTLKPKAHFEYFRLQEDGYEEAGGGAIDLLVEERTSEALTGSGSLTASYRFGRRQSSEVPFTLEFEGGWRSVLAGQLGETSAAFGSVDSDADGDDDTDPGETFTLAPDPLQDGWFSEARVLLGGYGYTLQLAAGAEQTQGGIDLSARASFSVGF